MFSKNEWILLEVYFLFVLYFTKQYFKYHFAMGPQ